MEFRILGPLEIRSGTGITPLPRRRERALLAALLLHPNEVVSTDRLIEALWGESPPRTAMGSLQNAVSSLRKALDADTLRTQPPGYVLAVDADDVDATRFERLVRQASGLDPPERAEVLAQALALWRGPALGDVADEPFAATEAARLDELRLVAVEERIAADLELGRDAELIPELEAHVAAHPLREQARGQLILALYRAGRQAEALEAYQDARRELVDELGIDPSPDLQDLERRILRQDPSLVTRRDGGGGAPVATAPDAARKTVTVLAASLAGADGLDPEQLRPRLDIWLDAVRVAVERHGGALDRYLGTDAVAVFGLPAIHEDDALRAVRAAVDLREGLAAGGATARIGVATGEALVGVGTAPVVGDVVAVATSLRDAASPGDVLAAASTLELVRDAVSTGSEAEITAASRSFTATHVLAAEGAYGRARRLDAPLVGREAVLDVLRDALARSTTDGRCVAVAVIGEAGIGKTRLARELTTTIARGLVLEGACVPYGEGTTYRPVLELIRQAAGEITPAAIGRLFDPPDDRSADDLASLLSEAPAARGDVFVAIRALLASLARRQPVVVVLDDLHWADATLLDLVEYLADRVAGSVLLACLCRPELLESRPEWGDGSGRIALLRLEPLSAETSRSALEAIAGDAVDDATAGRIVARAAGNPLHLEQLLAFAAEGGDLASDAVPSTIEAVLAQRLDHLDRSHLDVLRRASVLGESMTRGGVLALAEERDAVDPALLALVRRGLLHPEPSAGSDDAYAFHHALLRNVAYGELTKEARATLHEQAARWVDRDGDGLDEVVGYHLEHAYVYSAELGNPSEDLATTAGERLARAAWREWRGNNVTPAIDLYSRALGLVPEASAARAELEYELAVALRIADRLAESGMWLDQAQTTAAQIGARAIGARVRIEKTVWALSTGESTPGDLEDLVRAEIPVLEAAEDIRGLARAYLAIDQALSFTGRYGASAAASEQALARYHEIDYSPAAPTLNITNSMVFGPTPTREAIARCEVLRTGADRTTVAAVTSALGALHALRGEFETALESLSLSVELWEEVGVRRSSATTAVERQLFVARLQGQFDEAETIARARLQMYSHSGLRAWEATAAAQLAWILLEREAVDDAAALTEQAALTAHPHDVLVQSLIGALRGRILARRGDSSNALEHARAGVGALDGTDGLIDLATASIALAEVELLTGYTADARISAGRAEAYCKEKDAPALWASLSRHVALV